MMTKMYNPPSEPLTVVSDSVSLTRGAHLVTVVSKCVECHDTDLGGKVFINDPAFARIVATNLTMGKGGLGGRYSDALNSLTSIACIRQRSLRIRHLSTAGTSRTPAVARVAMDAP